MRIDKYLKVSKLIKRRTLAKKATDLERVYINNTIVKPSKEVKHNDIIKLELGSKTIIVRVVSIDHKAKEMFELISLESSK